MGEGGDLADRRLDQNRKCVCKRKSMENMTVVFSNFGTRLNRLRSPLSALRLNAEDGLIERKGLRSVHPANVSFVLDVKGEADVFGFDSEHRDLEQTLTLK